MRDYIIVYFDEILFFVHYIDLIDMVIDKNFVKYFKYIKDNAWRNFTKISGGHPSRAGGGVLNNEPEFCHNWVQKIISCEDFLD